MKFLSSVADPRFGVVVVDNSDLNSVSLHRILQNIDNKIAFKLIRNKYHLGPDSSLIKSLQMASSKWIYLLGDSKIPVIDFFENFIENINGNNDVAGIVYSFDKVLSKERIISSFDEMIASKIKFGDLFLGGNTILHADTVRKYLSIASQMTLTRSILTVFNVMSLVDKRQILFSEKKIVDQFLEKPPHYNPRLSLLECWSQFNLLVMLPISYEQARQINALILKNEKWNDYWIFIKFCLIKIFREKTDIRKNLKLILACRYIFVGFSIEKFFIYPLYWTSIAFSYMHEG